MITSGKHTLNHPISIAYNDKDIEVLAVIAWTHIPEEPATMEHPGRDEQIEIAVFDSFYYDFDGEKKTYPLGMFLEVFEDEIKEEILAECVE